ncbi:MAG: hypothetical protein HQL69_13480 [Magnetococcales bacterium]|nr:hypothetical protein [Magnetococcales bacterium]
MKTRSNKILFSLGSIVFLLLATFSTQAVASGFGHCGEYDFTRFYQGNKLQWAGLARVLRQDTPVYSKQTGEKRAGFLLFNQQAEVLAEKGDWIKIHAFRYKGRDELTGWARKTDLLCRDQPVKGESGLEMKFFIKTNMVARGEGKLPPTVQIYQDPELRNCVGGEGNCREGASRFHMYFVFDQNKDAYLLADRYRLEEDDTVLGWVAKKDGFLWNNAFSIRPREDLQAPDGSGDGTICTYERLSDAVNKNQTNCSPVQGGKKWFKSALRIPVLEMVDSKNKHISPTGLGGKSKRRSFFKVALARPGLVGRRVSDDKIAISTGLASQIIPGFKAYESLSSKKNVDIFFLLDATASMEQVFDAVRGTPTKRGVIQEIIEDLKNVQGFKDTQFRFGFRVYRDPYADKLFPNGLGDGVGEGHPLPASCSLNAAQQSAAFKSFQRSISKVNVSEVDTADDYQENLYGGLAQVLREDIVSCPDHLKVLFVIGDNGYKSRTGRSRAKYKNPVNRNTLVNLLKGGEKGNNIVPFFIQTPSRATGVKHPNAYRKAYNQFTQQTKYLLQNSLPANSFYGEHALRMGEERMVHRLTSTVEKLGSSELIDEIILDVRGGAALTAVIERLRRERIDIPGVYWHILKKGACGELGKQCENRVFDTTKIGYIEATDKVVEELWVSSSALSSWIRILRGFEGYFDLPESQLRRALISAMILGLQQEIRRPPIDVSGETPAEYAQRRGGLPVRSHSPLLSYNVNSLSAERMERNKDGRFIVLDHNKKPLLDNRGMQIPAVPACELRRLALWAIKSKEMLEIVERDYMRPTFKVSRYQPRRCPDATQNGRALMRIKGSIQGTALGPDKSYRFAHTFGGRRGYWIPQEYLP